MQNVQLIRQVQSLSPSGATCNHCLAQRRHGCARGLLQLVGSVIIEFEVEHEMIKKKKNIYGLVIMLYTQKTLFYKHNSFQNVSVLGKKTQPFTLPLTQEAWTFSELLEPLALIPQYIVCYRAGGPMRSKTQ